MKRYDFETLDTTRMSEKERKDFYATLDLIIKENEKVDVYVSEWDGFVNVKPSDVIEQFAKKDNYQKRAELLGYMVNNCRPDSDIYHDDIYSPDEVIPVLIAILYRHNTGNTLSIQYITRRMWIFLRSCEDEDLLSDLACTITNRMKKRGNVCEVIIF